MSGRQVHDVAVVGGGAIGLSCAFFLESMGANVVVVDAALCGQGASFGNAGQINLGSGLFAGPGVLRHGIRWLLRPKSPLYISLRARPQLAAWLWLFRQACTEERYRRAYSALVALNARTFSLFDELRASGVAFEMHKEGIILLALHESTLDMEEAQLELHRSLGYEGVVERLDRDSLRAREPAVGNAVRGGLHLRDERWVEPASLCTGLREYLKSHGVKIVERSPVARLRDMGEAGWALELPRSTVRARRVVVAAGVGSQALLGGRLRTRTMAGKGYSVLNEAPDVRPRHALLCCEARVGISPFFHGLQLAGTVELGVEDTTLNKRRLGPIEEAGRTYLQEWDAGGHARQWAGLRPLTPDSLPLIGAVPAQRGLFVATGHGKLGITLGPATGALLAPLVLSGEAGSVLEPFRPGRF